MPMYTSSKEVEIERGEKKLKEEREKRISWFLAEAKQIFQTFTGEDLKRILT